MPTSDLSEGLGTDDCLPDFYFDVPDEVLSNYPMHVTETVSNINTTLSNCVFNNCTFTFGKKCFVKILKLSVMCILCKIL